MPEKYTPKQYSEVIKAAKFTKRFWNKLLPQVQVALADKYFGN